MNEILDLLYPPRCGGCDALGSWWCARCAASARPAGLPRPRHIRAVAALGRFDGSLRQAVHRLKYRREAVLGEPLGAALGDAVAHGLALGWRVEALVPVPLSPDRQRHRGYDQAELLCRAASRRCGVPATRALRRVRETPTQVGLGRAAREANLRDAFVASDIRGGIVLIDDVTTTGATLSECARTLRAAGAREVRAVVVAVEA